MGSKSKKSEVRNKKFLEVIVAKKKQQLFSKTPRNQKIRVSDYHIIRKSETPSSSRFLDIFANNVSKKMKLFAEIKFASPTNPQLGLPEDLLLDAKAYEQYGADAVSVITEKHFFKGDADFVSQVKKYVSLPVLQKDFVIDKAQIFEAKAIGSDALLLIARLVSGKTLKEFVAICFSLGIEPIVEVNNEEDLQKAVETKTKIIAVNARDLETFKIDIAKACILLKQIPKRFIKLGFSGILSAKEVQQYRDAGINGILIGTSLMQAEDIKDFIKSLKI